MNQIYLIRHGQTENNVKNIWGGCSEKCDVSLTETGRKQADAVAEYLQNVGVKAVFCSHLKRAVETAERISARIGVPYHVKEDLHEVDYGAADGLTYAEIERNYPELYAKFMGTDMPLFDNAFPGGESVVEVLQRVLPVLADICRHEECSAVVLHGGNINLLRRYFRDPVSQVKNCDVFRLAYDGTKLIHI